MKAKELTQAALVKGIDLKKTVVYQPEVIKAKGKLKEPGDEDYYDWEKNQ